MKPNRVIIAGSRTVSENDPDLVMRIHKILINIKGCDLEIVSGTCGGADRLGEYYAAQYGISVKQFPADWKTLGKSAGPIRNKQMSDYATHLIAIWDGSSVGTRHMIESAKRNGLKVRVIKI